jgi:hypothetical protein
MSIFDSHDIDATRLYTCPPMPLEPMRWDIGWLSKSGTGGRGARDAPRYAILLSDARGAAMRALLGHRESPAEVLAESVVVLTDYAKLLAVLNDKSPPRDMGQRRELPPAFHWYFPGELETRSVDLVSGTDLRLVPRVHRATHPGLELLCVGVAAAILAFNSAKSFYMSNHSDRAREQFGHSLALFESVANKIPGTHSDSMNWAFNEAQWARMSNQSMPMQLQLLWLYTAQAMVRHTHHMCVSSVHVKVAGAVDADVSALVRGIESTALAVLNASRAVCTHRHLLDTTQTRYATDMDNAALASLVRFRAQGMARDAELASLDHIEVAEALDLLGKRGWWAFSRTRDADARVELTERSANLAATIDCIRGTAFSEHASEAVALEWRAQLRVHIFEL